MFVFGVCVFAWGWCFALSVNLSLGLCLSCLSLCFSLTLTWISLWDFGDDVFLLYRFVMCFVNKMLIKFNLLISRN